MAAKEMDGGNRRRARRVLLPVLVGLWLLQAVSGGAADLEVRRVGLSRVKDDTLLTVMLNRAANPTVSQHLATGKPQVVVDFPQARAGRLPSRLGGDDLLVEQVRIEPSAVRGVRIILDLFPDRPFSFWRLSRPQGKDQAVFILGLKPEAGPSRLPSAPPPAPAAPPEARPTPGPTPAQEPAPPPTADDHDFREERGTAATGSFAELQRLMPKARPLLQSLEQEGWTISQANTYDRPGQRFAQDFHLTNRRYPELSVKIVHLPANTPGAPHINLITMTADNLGGEDAAQYRQLRQWKFSQIKQKYEDIGDFFDDALKPLRIKLREQTKELVLRHASVWQTFLQRACPQNPQVADKALAHVREKVNQRFEGVQYTLSEDPLMILNLVDFLYVRVYDLETG